MEGSKVNSVNSNVGLEINAFTTSAGQVRETTFNH
jgi:hypothetical protein